MAALNATTIQPSGFAQTSEVNHESPTSPRTVSDDVLADRSFGSGETSLSRYLSEIGRVELLTVQQEIELASRIQQGDKHAREHMIHANLRLVVKIARDYERFGLPLQDLISEGNIGLMKAVDRFDPAKGARFATYGAIWIKQFIRRALTNQSKTIQLPQHVVSQIYKMHRYERSLFEELGREPTEEELGEALGITAARVAALRLAALRPASMEAPLGDGDSGNLLEVVQDESAANPADRFAEQAEAGMLHELVKKLPAREANVLRARYGLDDGSQKTLEEISEKFGVTRERIRQIQDSALRKMRRMCRRLNHVPEDDNQMVESFA